MIRSTIIHLEHTFLFRAAFSFPLPSHQAAVAAASGTPELGCLSLLMSVTTGLLVGEQAIALHIALGEVETASVSICNGPPSPAGSWKGSICQ